MQSNVVPIVRYADAEAAIHWLTAAFGFEVFLSVPGQSGRIEHARLTLEGGMVMLASLGREGAFESRFRSPSSAGGVTQCILMFVRDPDHVYRLAKSAAARILDEPHDFEFGGRSFSCEDPEGHLWVFSSHDPWQKLW